MRPQVIVIVLPALALFAHLAQAGKEVSVEKFAAKRAVKTFNIDVLSRTGGLNPVRVNLLVLVLGQQHLADEFGVVIPLNPGGHAVVSDQDGEQGHDPGGRAGRNLPRYPVLSGSSP